MTAGRLAQKHLPPRTVCKVCWHTVFATDETEWVTSPAPGIAHATCVREPTTED